MALTIEEGKTPTKTKSIKIFKGVANVTQAREPSKIYEILQSTENDREGVVGGNKRR